MTHIKNTENSSNNERRASDIDRRTNAERRSKERLACMRAECRKNVPRRESDSAGRLIEGELWWNGTHRFF